MSVSTAISRVTGFVRNWAMAYAMGVTIVSSSYVVANNIPNMVFELVAGGVLSSVFIPIFIERIQRDGEKEAWKLASYVFNLALILLGLTAILGTVFAESFVRTQTFRISAEEARLATFFFRFFAVQVVFYGAIAIFTGILNSYRRFLAPAAAPIFNNLVVIATLFGIYLPFRESNPDLAMTGLAIGTTLGVLVMALFMIPSLRKVGIRYTPRIDLSYPPLRKMGRKILPLFGYVAANMIALSARNAYAFEVSDKGPAALQYAWMWYQLPYGIFAVSVAMAIFPELSSAAEAKDHSAFKAHFNKGLRATGMLVLPVAAVLVALAPQVITLYRAGDFSSQDVSLVSDILVWWAIGLFSFSAYMYVLKAFYATQDTMTPMLTNFGAASLRVVLYATLTVGIAGFAGLGLEGIPATDAIVYSLNFLWLSAILRKRIGALDARATFSGLARTIAASVGGGLVAWTVASLLDGVDVAALGFFTQLVLAGSIGLATAYGLAILLRVPEIEYARRMIRRVGARIVPGMGQR